MVVGMGTTWPEFENPAAFIYDWQQNVGAGNAYPFDTGPIDPNTGRPTINPWDRLADVLTNHGGPCIDKLIFSGHSSGPPLSINTGGGWGFTIDLLNEATAGTIRGRLCKNALIVMHTCNLCSECGPGGSKEHAEKLAKLLGATVQYCAGKCWGEGSVGKCDGGWKYAYPPGISAPPPRPSPIIW